MRKFGYVYLGDGSGWHSNFDLLFNTFTKIKKDNDTSEWAHKAFDYCFHHMAAGLRWPHSLENYIVHKRKGQTKMTRDPWIAGYSCAVHLKAWTYLDIKMPWKLYRPEVWAWRRALVGKPNLYLFWRWLNKIFPKKDFVKNLDRIMWETYGKMANRRTD